MLNNDQFKQLLEEFPECREVFNLQNDQWDNEGAFCRLLEIKGSIPEPLYAMCLRIIYTEDTQDVSTETLVAAFAGVKKEHIMNDEEAEIFNKLPHVIKIYRGAEDYNEINPRVSWSLDESVAKGFARYHLFTAEIEKSEISALFCSGTDEEEVVAIVGYNFTKVY